MFGWMWVMKGASRICSTAKRGLEREQGLLRCEKTGRLRIREGTYAFEVRKDLFPEEGPELDDSRN